MYFNVLSYQKTDGISVHSRQMHDQDAAQQLKNFLGFFPKSKMECNASGSKNVTNHNASGSKNLTILTPPALRIYQPF